MLIHRAGAKHLYIPGGSLGVRACSAGEIGGAGGVTSTRSVQFDATSNQYIDCGALSAVDGVSQQTISFWAKRSSLNKNCAVGKRGTVEYNSVSWYLDENIYFQKYPAYGYVANASINWVHIAEVLDGSQTGNSNRLRAYVNGIAQTLSYSGVVPATTTTLAGNWRIGLDFNDYTTGYIDDVRIYNTALTPTDVANLYAGQDVTDGLVAYWPLEEGSGTNTVDTVGGNNGTLINGPTWSTDVPAPLT